VNTARGRTPSPPDLLPDEQAILRWAQAQRLYLDGELPGLLEVLQLRERFIAAINQYLALGHGCHQLTRTGGEWQLRFAPAARPLLLQAIAQSAAATLADPLLVVRRCAGDTCSLFFIDDSPNQSRHWCSQSLCGREMRVERRRGLLR
jgi:predicted RNA-binding Zn ribbon-like protein